ncbi:MAG TPA: hypothetical protein VFK54_00350 [Candidatus Limnocylindrales bacterium]|nr:hypothetical protein [Candidatus Limnocylindrales bacterium]
MSPVTEIANTELVLLAMALVGAADEFVDIEVIAEKAFELSPQRFGWRTRQFPSDKTVVQAVADLERKHGKDRLTRRGVQDQADDVATRRLTAEGRAAALQVAEKVAGRSFSDLAAVISHFAGESEATAPAPTPAERRRVQSELLELRRHRVYQEWADGNDLGDMERWQLYDALSCLPDAPLGTVRGQLEHFDSVADKWGDSEIREFLKDLGRAAGVGSAG